MPVKPPQLRLAYLSLNLRFSETSWSSRVLMEVLEDRLEGPTIPGLRPRRREGLRVVRRHSESPRGNLNVRACSRAGRKIARQREHRCVSERAVKHQTPDQCALPHSPDFLRNPMACGVPDGNDNLEPDEIGDLERPVAQRANGAGCHALPCRRGSNPIAKVGPTVDPVDLIQTTAAEICAVQRHDREFEGRPCLKCRDLSFEP